MELSSGKKIMRNTMFLYFRMILIMLISLYTVRLVLKILGVEDYGIYNAVGGVVTSMTFLTSVLTNASQRYFAVELAKDKNNKINKVFSSIFYVYVAISILIIAAVEIVGIWLISNKLTIPDDRLNVAFLVFHVSLATFIINVLSSPFRAVIIAYERMDVYAYISLFEAIGKLVIVFFLYYTSIDKLLTYALLLLIIAVVNNILYISFSIAKLKLRMSFTFDGDIIKSVAGYSSWTMFGSIAGVVNVQGNSILLNIFIGPIANTAFAISNQVSAAVQQFSSNFYTAVAPPLMKSYSSGNASYMNSLFWFSSKAVFFLSFVILIPIFTQTDFVLTLWLGEVSPYMVNFVRIILIYSLVISVSNPISTIVQAAGRVKLYHSLVDGFSLIVFPISYILLKMGYGPEFALGSMVMIFVIAHMLRLWVLSKIITFSVYKYFKNFIMPCFVIILFSGITIYLIGLYKNDGSKMMSFIYMLITFIISSALTFFLLFSKEERVKLLSYLPIKGIMKKMQI